MAQVELFKKEGTYKDKENKDKKFTNFYIRCGSALIPIEPKFFPNSEGKDPQFGGRKEVMKAFSDILPEKSEDKQKTE